MLGINNKVTLEWGWIDGLMVWY